MTSQLAELQTEAGNLETTGAKIIDLLRQREVWERGYRNYKASLEQSHIDEKLPNIKVTEDPTPPFMAASKTKKNMLMALAGGIFGGIGWAFLIELVLDRSVRTAIPVCRLTRRQPAALDKTNWLRSRTILPKKRVGQILLRVKLEQRLRPGRRATGCALTTKHCEIVSLRILRSAT